eukprot:TRINITY_DN6201_c0_g3_i2.p2 TRINITY_DN6201_c0_g3~~TRINITY_DN6201_c0_g3_i2.p2  ORF type:complete len:292 (+),score=81.13 TRINITY_DN6201_c0_g3_i2:123-998(+)
MASPSPQQEMLKRLVEARCNIGKQAAIRKHDMLMVIDMQADFLCDGRLPLADMSAVETPAVEMIRAASAIGAKVVATKAAYPHKHVNFTHRDKKLLKFPPHCIEGTEGAMFTPKVAEALQEALRRQKANKLNQVHICYKGFCAEVPSYGGALPYPPEYAASRLGLQNATPAQIDLTGSFELKASCVAEDVNAPPDICSVTTRTPIRDLFWGLPDNARIFICGVGLDLGVLDTAYCLANLQRHPIIVADASAPMSDDDKGMWSRPADVAYVLNRNGVKLCSWNDVAGKKRVP